MSLMSLDAVCLVSCLRVPGYSLIEPRRDSAQYGSFQKSGAPNADPNLLYGRPQKGPQIYRKNHIQARVPRPDQETRVHTEVEPPCDVLHPLVSAWSTYLEAHGTSSLLRLTNFFEIGVAYIRPGLEVGITRSCE